MKRRMTTTRRRFVLLHVALPLTAGAIIYLLFRDADLVVFRLAEWLGLAGLVEYARQVFDPIRPHRLIVYSLPGALWLYAFIALMAIVWRGEGTMRSRAPWILLPLLVAVGSEGAQWLGLTDGTFDWGDVGLYGVAVLVALLGMGFLRSGDRPELQAPDLRFRHRLCFACALGFSLIIGAADVVSR